MEPAENDESISLLGEALQNTMASDDGHSDELIQAGDTMEFHRYMDLPFHVREMIRDEAIDHHDYFAHFASVSKEWQGHVEGYLFRMIRIDPSVEEDALKFKQLFKNERRGYLEVLDIIIDDRKTGPWHTANGIVQISLVIEKIRMLFHYINSWDPHQAGDLEIKFVSLDLGFVEFEIDETDVWKPCIQTTSLWTKSQLHLLGTSNLASHMPLWSIWSEFPKDFGIAKRLTFPLDCVPLPTTMAIIETIPNLVSCSFELAFERMADEGNARASEEGMASLADFVQKLPTLTPFLREMTIRTPRDSPPGLEAASTHRLSAALRDSSQNLRTLNIDGIFLHQNFFESFGEGRDPMAAAAKWRWPNLEEMRLAAVTHGPCPGPYSRSNQLSLTPTELVVAAGRATMAMPLLRIFELDIWGETEDSLQVTLSSISRTLPQHLGSSGECEVTLAGFTKDQEQRILCAWAPFLRAKVRLVSEELHPHDSKAEGSDDDFFYNRLDERVYKTFPEDRSPSTLFGAAALVNNAEFLEAQRLARTKSGISSHSIPWL